MCRGNFYHTSAKHSVKSVHIRSFPGTYFSAFGLNMKICFVNLIHFEFEDIRTKKSPNTDTCIINDLETLN